MPAELQKARELFLHAVGKVPPEQWDAYVADACRGDAELAQQVGRFLQVHREAGSFLESPAPAQFATIDVPVAEAPGTIIGPYKLLQQIGEGGMGTVFLAEQTHPVQRKVALKIIKAGMDSRQVIARFEAERQALALMDHPNIAKVLDAGTVGSKQKAESSQEEGPSRSSSLPSAFCLPPSDSGRPYFVMELVKGIPITKYCDQAHLTPKERLELFIPVCQAVQHAHQKGIIHRDLKPSNVLIALYDGKPIPKVIDFGVAKATAQKLTERTMFTEVGQIVGTLEYMAPEQAELNNLDIDTRADIYSLGVILYELLTGSPPFTAKQLRSAAFDEMLRMIREVEPAKPSTRLSSSNELPSIAANRNLEPAKLAKVVHGELDWIVMKALEKDRNRRYETANGFAMDVQRYLADEPVQACPPSAGYRLRKFARRNRGALAVAALVLFFLVLLGGSIGWAARDRAARQAKVTAQAELILAEVERLQGEQKWREALAAAQRAEVLVTGGGDAALERRLRDVLADLELVRRLEEIRFERHTRVEERIEDWGPTWAKRTYAAAFRERGFDLDQMTAEQAIAQLRPRRVAVAFAAALDDWAMCCTRDTDDGSRRLWTLAGQLDPDPWRRKVRDAMARKDMQALEALAASGDLTHQPAPTIRLLGALLSQANTRQRGIEVLRRAQAQYPADFGINYLLALYLRYSGEGVTFGRVAVALSPHSVDAHLLLGGSLEHTGKLEEAIACLRKAIELRPKYSIAHNNLGVFFGRQKKPGEAIACYRKAIELDPTIAAFHRNLGGALRGQKMFDEAIACCRKAIELDPKSATAHTELGMALSGQKKLDEASASLRKAIELDATHARAHAGLGEALLAQKKLTEAVAACRKAIELDPRFAWAHTVLGSALSKQNKVDEAIASFRNAIKLDPKLPRAHSELGVEFFKQGKLENAIACFRKAIELDATDALAHGRLGDALWAQKKLPEAIAACRKAVELDPKNATLHASLGSALAAQKRLPEAIAAYRKAIDIDPKKATAHLELGRALHDQKNLDEAIASYRKAIELDPTHAPAYASLGNALRAQKKLPEAIAACRKAIELDPTNARGHSNLGHALRDQKMPDEAIACYCKAIELDPKNGLAHINLGALFVDHLRDYRQASECFRKAIELDPRDPLAHSNLGVALYRQGKLDEAIVCWRKAIELDPKRATAHSNLGQALLDQETPDEAIACYRKAIELAPKHAQAHFDLGRAYGKQQKLNEAIASYRKAIELDPRHDAAHTNLGVALYKQGKLDEAIVCWRKAIEVNAKDIEAHSNLGVALATQKKFDEAVVSHRNAIELNPKRAASYYNIGLVFGHQKKFDEAVASYRKAIELDPKYASAHYDLGVVLSEQKNFAEAIACYRKAIELDPQYAQPHNNLAWLFAACPDAKQRDTVQAVAFAKKAVELEPKSGSAHGTLGVAYYRAGNWKAAIASHETSIKLGSEDSYDFFVLAMAHWQLDDKETARGWYERGVEWMSKHQPTNEELRRFRAEAAELIGIEKKN